MVPGGTNCLYGANMRHYAYGLITKYGEGSAALAAEMYDETAALSGMDLPPAEVAETAGRNDVAKAVQGTIKQSMNPNSLGGTVSRLVKQAGADTTLKNAKRDGAQFAWVPFGDTCPFCLALASRGFQYISAKSLRNGHAEHIHANCDCAYTVRFDKDSGVKGYDPDKYLKMYEDAEGKTSKEKINSMRRLQYQDPSVAERIRAQKRAAYALKQEQKDKAKEKPLQYELQFFAKKHKTHKVPKSDPLWDSLVQGDVEWQLEQGVFNWQHGGYDYVVEINERYDYNYLSKKKIPNIHEKGKQK